MDFSFTLFFSPALTHQSVVISPIDRVSDATAAPIKRSNVKNYERS
jgi:hypothetical protein